jgi:hypothetical protein
MFFLLLNFRPVIKIIDIFCRFFIATLKAWLYEHRKNPYPTKSEKLMLAIITKMSLTQISTWFANARRRLKKETRIMSKRSDSSSDDDDDDDVEIKVSRKRRFDDDHDRENDNEDKTEDRNQTDEDTNRKSKKPKIWSIVDVVHG